MTVTKPLLGISYHLLQVLAMVSLCAKLDALQLCDIGISQRQW